jgi:hypothetical protein
VRGAAIVALAVLCGMAYGAHAGLDGVRTALCVALAWMILTCLRYGVEAIIPPPRRRGRR